MSTENIDPKRGSSDDSIIPENIKPSEKDTAEYNVPTNPSEILEESRDLIKQLKSGLKDPNTSDEDKERIRQ